MKCFSEPQWIKAIIPILILRITTPTISQNQEVLFFSYFKGNGEDGLHLAMSEDGYCWQTLNDEKSLLVPEVGESVLMRDPCIILGPNDHFHMVWTAGWGEKGIGYANMYKGEWEICGVFR